MGKMELIFEIACKCLFFFITVEMVREAIKKCREEKEEQENQVLLSFSAYAKVLFFTGIFFAVVLFGISFLDKNNDSLLYWIISLIVLALLLVLALLVNNWKIIIGPESIIKRSFWGKEIQIPLNKLKFYRVQRDGSLKVFGETEDIILDSEMKRREVLKCLEANGIKENNYQKEKGSFEVSAGPIGKTLGVILLLASLFLVVIGLLATNMDIFIFFLILFVASLCICRKRFKDKYVFDVDKVYVSSFGKSKKEYAYSEIHQVEKKEFDNKDWLIFKGKDTVLFRINMDYDGMDELLYLIHKKHWMKEEK